MLQDAIDANASNKRQRPILNAVTAAFHSTQHRSYAEHTLAPLVNPEANSRQGYYLEIPDSESNEETSEAALCPYPRSRLDYTQHLAVSYCATDLHPPPNYLKRI